MPDRKVKSPEETRLKVILLPRSRFVSPSRAAYYSRSPDSYLLHDSALLGAPSYPTDDLLIVRPRYATTVTCGACRSRIPAVIYRRARKVYSRAVFQVYHAALLSTNFYRHPACMIHSLRQFYFKCADIVEAGFLLFQGEIRCVNNLISKLIFF